MNQENDESIASNKSLEAILSATKPMFKQMKEMNAGMMKIAPVVNGRKFFSIILVQGEAEVEDVEKALQAVEGTW